MSEPCFDTSPRWKRQLNHFRRETRVAQWGLLPALWFHLHSLFLRLTMGDPGWFGDWAADYRWQHLIHRWFCRRWVPAWERYRARTVLR